MSCDIHIQVEVFCDGHWQHVGPIFNRAVTLREDGMSSEPYDGQPYELFAALADVRNDYGIKPILYHDELPVDRAFHPASDSTPKMTSDVDYFSFSDLHSHGWCTLAQLDAYDWDQLAYDDAGNSAPLRELIGPDWFEVMEELRALATTREVKAPPRVSGGGAGAFGAIFGDVRGVPRELEDASTEHVRILYAFDN
jgi:hypothetical protein